jgi:hypothetical protein
MKPRDQEPMPQGAGGGAMPMQQQGQDMMGQDPMGQDPMAAGAPSMPGEPRQASPEEQALYNRFVANAYNLVYDEKMLPKMLDILEGEGDPVAGLASAASTVIVRVAEAAQRQGQQLSGDVLFNAGTEVFEDLAELSRTAKIKDFAQDPDALEGAYFRALDETRVMLQESGVVDQDAAMADMQQLAEMDQNGKYEEMLRNLAGNDPRMAGQPQGEEGMAPPSEEPPPRRGLMG